ncbi:DUF2946 domain-containing protein [Tepidimonas taiwanensis]|uniref:DUF2946 domain-containing protein n=1 Tax=Tepidimonas taiwanensis TaxID=307486 RepID=UPI0005B9E06A|nr:DUF2946 domain-containing protein [Tepidimonas taiwanensis]
MTFPRVRWPLWLATLALLWASLSTALARAWVDDGAGRIEICTSTGVAWVQADPDGAWDGTPASAAAPMDCDWCLLGAAGPALPPTDALPWPRADAAARHPIGQETRHAVSARWVRPTPRAPPVVAVG